MDETATGKTQLETDIEEIIAAEDEDEAGDDATSNADGKDASLAFQNAVNNILIFAQTGKFGTEAKEMPGVPVPAGADMAASVEKDGEGRITQYKSEFGSTTQIKYDAQGRMLTARHLDSEGRVAGLQTVTYDDAQGTRTSVDVSYDEKGNITSTFETTDRFKNGKLRAHSEKDAYTASEMTFDEKGRQIRSWEKKYDLTEVTIDREYTADGGVKVTATSRHPAHDTGITRGTYDSEGKITGPMVSARVDKDGKEVSRTETTFTAGGYSRTTFENGEFKSHIEVTRRNEKGQVKSSEIHRDEAGKVIKTVDYEMFKMQPYLPTKMTISNPDGTVKEALEINYALTPKGGLATRGPYAMIENFSHTTPAGETVKMDFKTPVEQTSKAWREVFKASTGFRDTTVPIGRPNGGARIYGPHIDDAHGRSAEDIAINGTQTAA